MTQKEQQALIELSKAVKRLIEFQQKNGNADDAHIIEADKRNEKFCELMISIKMEQV